MPTVIKPGPSRSRGFRSRPSQSGKDHDPVLSSPSQLLRYVSPDDRLYPILRSSFSVQHDPGAVTLPCSIAPSKNGFAHTVIRACSFVNGNAEALRPIFVAHEDRPELVVDASPDTIETVDLGAVAQQLAAMVEGRLRDPTEYFRYGIQLGCSFPSVTLLGERRDWADMLRHVAWFGTIGHDETAAWTVRLTKVLEYMVASFDRPDETDVKHFWTRAVHETGANMSGGLETLSGWLTAFCWWKADGRRVQNYSDEELSRHEHPEGPAGYRRLTLDGVEFPVMERTKVPDGMDPKEAALLAGSVGMQVMGEDGETAAQPASGWWLLSTSERLPKT
ncbi:hypothetical protein C8A01DRAFT_49042 [Parachaetomium inaequale]|uniref:Uncharacterized protein n=1 Tax=Parachaetomium inaequale TaxID=2588326 RepID=A0AAN6PA91_9PEZI|nr:hypothetical protein C8A01DRAFT_49042 [Parachaetomium inaequale]